MPQELTSDEKKAEGKQSKGEAATAASSSDSGKLEGGADDWVLDVAAIAATGGTADRPGTRKQQKAPSKKEKERARGRSKKAAAKAETGPAAGSTRCDEGLKIGGGSGISAEKEGLSKGCSNAAEDSSAVRLTLSSITLDDYEEEPALAVRRPRRQ